MWLSCSAFFSMYYRVYSPVTFPLKVRPSPGRPINCEGADPWFFFFSSGTRRDSSFASSVLSSRTFRTSTSTSLGWRLKPSKRRP